MMHQKAVINVPMLSYAILKTFFTYTYSVALQGVMVKISYIVLIQNHEFGLIIQTTVLNQKKYQLLCCMGIMEISIYLVG